MSRTSCRAQEASRRARWPGGSAPRRRGRPWPGRRWGPAGRRGPRRGPAAGAARRHSSAASSRRASTPQAVSQPCRRWSLGEALGGGGHLEAADLQEAGLAVDVEGAELLDGVAGQLGHGLGRVGLEDQAGGVRRGAARWRAAAPWSTTVTSVQPRAESSSASAAPTTPAPMMTTRGPAIATPPIVAPDATQCVRSQQSCPTAQMVSRGPGRFAAPAGRRRTAACPPREPSGSRGRARGGGSAGQDSQASTLSGLASTHFLAAASARHLVLGDVLGDQVLVVVGPGEVLHQVVGRAARLWRTSR